MSALPFRKNIWPATSFFERILIRPCRFWNDKEVELLPGTRVETVRPGHRELALSGGERATYGKLI